MRTKNLSGYFDEKTKTAPLAGRRREHGRGRPWQSRERRARLFTSSKHHPKWWTSSRASVRLRWVRHRYPSVGLPIMHVLVVTHFHSRVEIGDSSFIPFLHDGRLRRGSCLALKPLVSPLRYASQVMPIRFQYLCPGNYRPCQGCSRQIPVHLSLIHI